MLEYFVKNNPKASKNTIWYWLNLVIDDLEHELDFDDTLSHLKSEDVNIPNLDEFIDICSDFASNTKLKRYRGRSYNECVVKSQIEKAKLACTNDFNTQDELKKGLEDYNWIKKWLKDRK